MQGSKLSGNPAKIEGLLSPKHVRYASNPPAAAPPRHKARSSLQRQLSGRTNERLIKVGAEWMTGPMHAVFLVVLHTFRMHPICNADTVLFVLLSH